MRSLAVHSVMYSCGEYAHRAAGHASFVLTHSATLNALRILYKIVGEAKPTLPLYALVVLGFRTPTPIRVQGLGVGSPGHP